MNIPFVLVFPNDARAWWWLWKSNFQEILLNLKWNICTFIWMRREFVCVRHSISKLEPITGRKSETAIPRNIDGSRIGKTVRRSLYKPKQITYFWIFLLENSLFTGNSPLSKRLETWDEGGHAFSYGTVWGQVYLFSTPSADKRSHNLGRTYSRPRFFTLFESGHIPTATPIIFKPPLLFF